MTAKRSPPGSSQAKPNRVYPNPLASRRRLRGRNPCRTGFPPGPASRLTNSLPGRGPTRLLHRTIPRRSTRRRLREPIPPLQIRKRRCKEFQCAGWALSPPIESGQVAHQGLPGPRRQRESAAPSLKAIQVHDSYLIAETRDGMMVIDQHALARADLV